MEQLVSEVSVLLKMLDQESLSSSAEEKKTSVWNLLQQIQPQGEDVSVKGGRIKSVGPPRALFSGPASVLAALSDK